MKKISIEETKKIQFEILKYVDNFCNEYNINYWLYYGSLLGCIRHEGYIPWDDDIDIAMLRKDYEKFIDIFNKKSNKYKVNCLENNKNFHLSFAKVCDDKTISIENGYSFGISIDIFPFDNVSNEKEAYKMHKKQTFLSYLDFIRNSEPNNNISSFKKIIMWIIRFILKRFPKNYFIVLVHRNSIKFNRIDCKYVDSFCLNDYKNSMVSPVNIQFLKSFEKGKFEDSFFTIPKDYDYILKNIYGDNYMEIPPIEKRRHHAREDYLK